MLPPIENRLATELAAHPRQVIAAIALLDDGATVPFIARYRKEATGGPALTHEGGSIGTFGRVAMSVGRVSAAESSPKWSILSRLGSPACAPARSVPAAVHSRAGRVGRTRPVGSSWRGLRSGQS
jgi:hypothetical protein